MAKSDTPLVEGAPAVEGTPPAVEQNPVQAAAAAIAGAQARVQISVGGQPGAPLPDVKFDRLSVERRVLGHVTDEVDETEYGPRNTLAALTRALMTDVNTTHAPAGNGRLDVDGASIEQVIQAVLDKLNALQDAGLVQQREDGTYAVTEAGHTELQS